MGRSLFAFLVVFVATNPPTFAQGNTEFAKILADPGEHAHVISAAKRSTVVIESPCSSANFEMLDEVAILVQPTFDANGITGGAWQRVVQEEGCGVKRTLNVLAVIQSPKTLTTMPLLPGTTHANPQLQKDAVKYAVIAAGGREPNCNIGYVANTEFLNSDGNAQRAPWRELWTLNSCTKTALVPMRFIPDKNGTVIVADSAKILPRDSNP
jgi:hypothetical protein